MATTIPPELARQFMDAVLNSCPLEQWASGALCALLEQGDGDVQQLETEARLRARLEQDPTNLEVLCALDRLHGDRVILIEVLRRRYDLTNDADERLVLLVRLGLLHVAAGSEDGVRSVIDLLQPRPAARVN